MNKFARNMIDRAIRTAAQSALAAIGTTAMIHEVDWLIVLSTAGMAAVLSVLMSLAWPMNADESGKKE